MRCFVIRTKPVPRINSRFLKRKIPIWGFFRKPFRKRRIRLHICKIPITVNRKFLLPVATIFIVALLLSPQFKNNEQAVPAFNIQNPDEIVSDVLPGEKEPKIITGIKKRISAIKKAGPEKIIKEFGGVLEELSTPPPSPLPTTPSETPNPVPEQKTISNEELFKNETDFSVSDDMFENSALDFSDKSTVLIIHTHTTESYTQSDNATIPDNGRSTDETKNMIAVGKVIKSELEAFGLEVIHDTTVHDYPSYQGAYGRSLSTAKKHLSANTKIEFVLDIHRDAITDEQGNRVKLIKEIDGTQFAQLMTVCGTDGGGLSHPYWKENLNFAVKLQQIMNSEYPGVMRPINIRKERFNQHLTKGSLIIEVGTHGNSLSEAENSAAIIAKKIGELLTKR